jgi:hypothetical protein
VVYHPFKCYIYPILIFIPPLLNDQIFGRFHDGLGQVGVVFRLPAAPADRQKVSALEAAVRVRLEGHAAVLQSTLRECIIKLFLQKIFM